MSRGKKVKLLEVGCATGNLLLMVKEFFPNITATGVDLSDYGIDLCRQQGLDCYQGKIDNFEQKNKYDIIFSSETMEHVEELDEFMGGINKNLSSKGCYIFYVPSVDEQAIKEQGPNYVSFNHSLEHIVYFTKEFFIKRLGKRVDAETYIVEFDTPDGPYILGCLTREREMGTYFQETFQLVQSDDAEKEIINRMSDGEILSTLTISAKFGKFNLAEKLISEAKCRAGITKNQINFSLGIYHFHKGETELSNKYISSSFSGSYPSSFLLKALYANYKGLATGYRQRLAELSDVETRLFKTEAELSSLKKSRFLIPFLKMRTLLIALRQKLRQTPRKLLFVIRNKMPLRIRRPLAYVLKLKWMIRWQVVPNKKHKSPLVSIITPYYNSADTIKETLESVLSQTFQDFEYIIVNDGSKRDQSELLDELKGPKVSIIHHNGNLGKGSPAAARNTGVKNSRGKYIICLDADDTLDPTFIEKSIVLLESDPNISIVTTYMNIFGVTISVYRAQHYNPKKLPRDNMVITAAMYRREVWDSVGGYKSGIGYEDWDFWISAAENGFWGRQITEPLFNYRTAVSSRYVDDQQKHHENIETIKKLHPSYHRKIVKIGREKYFKPCRYSSNDLFLNIKDEAKYFHPTPEKKNVLIAVPWMTFGGAETLIYNFCREIKNDFNISFITGLPCQNEWEYKFKEITPNIYHLANLFDEKRMYLEFISNYIDTRNIEILHIIHTDFVFEFLEELKMRHPKLKIVVTMFNDRVCYFKDSINFNKWIDLYTSDNQKVGNSYAGLLGSAKKTKVIPNGIDCYSTFTDSLFDVAKEKEALGIEKDELAVFSIGRLSKEKNPDKFVLAAREVLKNNKKVKFFVVGDGPMKKDVEKLISDSNTLNISYLGYQSDVAKYLSVADIFVLPSEIEGFPLSILEAMATNTVVIASSVGAIPDVITDGKNGFVVNPGDHKQIAKIIMKLSEKKDIMSKVMLSARNDVENRYSNKILGENYTKLYKEL
jgi:glycosyltransferase involved in cell wall biosynthesis/SAM-dependent methyltransferase